MRIFLIFLVATLVINTANAQWIRQNSGTQYPLNSVYFTSSMIGYTVGDEGTILSTLNGGKNWTTQISGISKSLKSLCFTDSLTGFVVGENGIILKTMNGGNNWIQQSGGTNVNLNSVSFFDSLNGFIVGEAGTILNTADGGNTWIQQTSGNTYSLSSVCFADTLKAYIITNGENVGWEGEGTVLKTMNGGANWDILVSGRNWIPNAPGGMYFFLTSVYFTDSLNGCIVGYGLAPNVHGSQYIEVTDSFILNTTDGGITWSETEGYGRVLMSVHFPDINTGYVVGDKGKILKTTNRGVEWSSETSGTDKRLRSVYFIDSLTGYAVGDHGIILKTTNGGLFGITGYTDEGFIHVYPNPVLTELTVLIHNSIEHCNLIILNEAGAEVYVQQIVDNLSVINVKELSGGVYFLKFFNNDFAEVEKIVKL
jgi:photosystem II stability/assembly factor-like uncharacterized protein